MFNRIRSWYNPEKDLGPRPAEIIVAEEPRHIPAAPHINITDVPEGTPDFKKKYSGKLSNNAKIELDVRSSDYFGRYWSGTLTQPNRNWVMFDPDKIADKILDPALVPLIEEFVKAAKQLDKEFVDSKPDTFVDEKGKIWKRIG